MKEALEAIINSLVSDTTEVSIKEEVSEKNIVFNVQVAASDMGKIIGKEGRIAKAIRTIMQSIATKEGKRVSIEFIDKE